MNLYLNVYVHLLYLKSIHHTNHSAMNLKGVIKGLHHVTATVSDAQEDYDFYSKTLGLRLIKETVNFDNESVYHFYYGNETGTPSTVFTTFPYKGQGVRKGVIGTGQVYETAFSVPAVALEFWKNRLKGKDITVKEVTRLGNKLLLFEDPSGLRLSIHEDASDNREPVWVAEGFTQEQAIIGIHHVVLAVEPDTGTADFLTFFGYKNTESDGAYSRWETSEKGAGNMLVLLESDNLPKGINGIGTVHHVAHRVADIKDSLNIKKEIEKRYGISITEVKDRKYFRSIYFRIPGNVLFEVATEPPGFLVDEGREKLGSSLKLPDWQEPRRKQIEKNLIPYQK